MNCWRSGNAQTAFRRRWQPVESLLTACSAYTVRVRCAGDDRRWPAPTAGRELDSTWASLEIGPAPVRPVPPARDPDWRKCLPQRSTGRFFARRDCPNSRCRRASAVSAPPAPPAPYFHARPPRFWAKDKSENTGMTVKTAARAKKRNRTITSCYVAWAAQQCYPTGRQRPRHFGNCAGVLLSARRERLRQKAMPF